MKNICILAFLVGSAEGFMLPTVHTFTNDLGFHNMDPPAIIRHLPAKEYSNKFKIDQKYQLYNKDSSTWSGKSPTSFLLA